MFWNLVGFGFLIVVWFEQEEPEMPTGKDAVDLGRAGFRQVGELPSAVLLLSGFFPSDPIKSKSLARACE